MKITEIEWGTNKTYVDENGFAWKAEQETLTRSGNDRITSWYNLRGLMSMDFEEQVDWSKVEVDTPILVSNGGKDWYKRHFAKFEDGKVFAFSWGGTSWTKDISDAYEYAKLATK